MPSPLDPLNLAIPGFITSLEEAKHFHEETRQRHLAEAKAGVMSVVLILKDFFDRFPDHQLILNWWDSTQSNSRFSVAVLDRHLQEVSMKPCGFELSGASVNPAIPPTFKAQMGGAPFTAFLTHQLAPFIGREYPHTASFIQHLKTQPAFKAGAIRAAAFEDAVSASFNVFFGHEAYEIWHSAMERAELDQASKPPKTQKML